MPNSEDRSMQDGRTNLGPQRPNSLLAALLGLLLATAGFGQLASPYEILTANGTPQSHIGVAALFVDLDNDGTDELLVGQETAGGAPAGAGAVILFDFQGCGGSSQITWSQPNLGLVNTANDFFGHSLAAGFFDEDEWIDVAIGIPGNPINGQANAGAVLIVYGHPSGFPFGTKQVLSQDNLAGAVEAGDYFGAVLAVGDFDQNGHDDLVVTSLYEDVGNEQDAGAVHIIYGGVGGLSTEGELILHQDVGGVQNAAQDFDYFGHALAVGEFSGDAYPDLAVGIPGESIDSESNAGAVQIFFGSAGGLTTASQFWHQDIPGILLPNGPDREFGFALATGDFDGNGADDLAVGAPGHGEGGAMPIQETGRVLMLFGDPVSGLGLANQRVLGAALAGQLHAFDRIGEVLDSGDFDDDGYDDLVFGSPIDNANGVVNAGGLAVRYGQPPGSFLLSSEAFSLIDAGLTPEIGDEFGFAVASGRPRVGIGGQWLFVTAPGRESASVATLDVGRIFVMESEWPFVDDFESGLLCRWSAVSP